jgi:protein gp37
MKQIIILYLFFLLLSNSIDCQNTIKILDKQLYQDPTKVYHHDFQKILNENLTKDYIIRFFAQPEFAPEYAFQIKRIDSLRFEISAIVLHDNLWYFNQNVDSIKVNLYKRIIEYELFSKLDRLFINLTNEHFVCTCGTGTAYCFKKQIYDTSCDTSNVTTNKDFPLWKLASICDLIMNYTIGNEIDLNYIIKRIDELIVQKEYKE